MFADVAVWIIAALYSLMTYFYGHQGSHIAAVMQQGVKLNRYLLIVLLVYNWLFLNYVFIVWYGYKTVWWYAVSVFVVSQILRLVWTKIEIETGALKEAWVISLIGIPTIPILLLIMINLTLQSTGTRGVFDACRLCP
jgi:hypothetical protein